MAYDLRLHSPLHTLPSLEAASLVVTERPLPGPAEGPGLGRSHHTRCTLDTLNTWQEWALLLII